MAAHLSLDSADDVYTSPTVIYTAPAGSVYLELYLQTGQFVAVGWYDSSGNTMHASAGMSEQNRHVSFGPLASGDQIIAAGIYAHAKIAIGIVY